MASTEEHWLRRISREASETNEIIEAIRNKEIKRKVLKVIRNG